MNRKIITIFIAVSVLLSFPLSAATFIVTNNLDSGPGSLRSALMQANANFMVPDVINFNIGGGGLWTITPLSPLPAITDPAGVFIDGLTQPGAMFGPNPPSTAMLMIELDGSFAGFSHGLYIQSDNNLVQGLVINRFQWDGIRVEGGIANITADMNVLVGNFVGTDPTGTIPMGNGQVGVGFYAGVHICNSPGGQALHNAVDMSLISDNHVEGVWIEGAKQPGNVGFNHVTGNYIGTDVTGTADLGNRHEGVCISEGGHDNDVVKNLISGNDYEGVGIQGYNNIPFPPAPPIQSHSNLILDNIIGLDINLNPLGNTLHGVAIGEYGPGQWGCANKNTVSMNLIAHNGGDGVAVWEDAVNTFNADNNVISRNSIYANMGLGIDLQFNGVTYNDFNDPDVLANEELNFPDIQSVTYAAGVTTIAGTLDTPGPSACVIEVFKAAADPSGYGEGRWYLGTVTPSATGAWSFSTILLVPSDFVTATTTDAMNNTSEFCLNWQVPGAPSLWTPTRNLPERMGGTVNFTLTAGAGNGGRNYLLLSGVSGIQPGTPLPGGFATLPLNFDAFTQVVFALLNTPVFSNFLGKLDGLGNASAQLNAKGTFPPGTAGLVFYFAYCINNPFNFASNHVAIQVTPW